MITRILNQEWEWKGEWTHEGLGLIASLKYVIDSRVENQTW